MEIYLTGFVFPMCMYTNRKSAPFLYVSKLIRSIDTAISQIVRVECVFYTSRCKHDRNIKICKLVSRMCNKCAQ